MTEQTTYEYGAMSSKYSLQAECKYDAYAAMVYHFNRSAHLIAIYSPEECKNDMWINITGQISDRLDEVFEKVGGFDKYVEDNIEKVKQVYGTIKKLV